MCGYIYYKISTKKHKKHKLEPKRPKQLIHGGSRHNKKVGLELGSLDERCTPRVRGSSPPENLGNSATMISRNQI